MMKPRSLSKRPSGRLSVRDSLAPYGVIIALAAVAAAFDWRWWIAAILVTPGFALYFKRSRAASKARGVVAKDETGEWIVSAIGILVGVLLGGFFHAHADLQRFTVLTIVAYMIFVSDPLSRVVRRWVQRRSDLPSDFELPGTRGGEA